RQAAVDLVAEFAHALLDECAIEVVVNIHGLPSTLARQRDGRSIEPNPLAQIARQHPLLGRQLHRRDIGIDRRKLVGERCGEELHCSRRRGHHCSRSKILGPAPVGRAINDCAIAEPVGGDDHRARDLELLLQRRGHAAFRAINASTSAARHGVERATTSPITSMAGPSPTSVAKAASPSRRPTAACESGRVPRASTAAGVAPSRPAAIKPSRTAAADASAMETTTPVSGPASLDQSIAAASSARWAVMKTSLPASLRNVRGRPTSAAQPSAAVIPGTTTTGTPAWRRYSNSSPPRPNTKGSPPLSRTTRRPARA